MKEQRKMVEVELEPGKPCPACGTVGPHFCTGGQPQGGGWVGVRKKTAKSVENVLDILRKRREGRPERHPEARSARYSSRCGMPRTNKPR